MAPFFGVIVIIALFVEFVKLTIKFLLNNPIIAGVIAIAVGIVIWVVIQNKRNKREKYKKFIEESRSYLLQKIKEHEKTLGIKRNQILRQNDYGHIDQKQRDEWNKEIRTFLTSIQFPSLDLFPVNEKLDFINMVDTWAKEASQNLVYDAEKVTPREYEAMCADILRDAGWEARLTKGSGDQGVDIVAQKNGKNVVLQCKRYSYPVGNSAVQEVLAGKSFYKADVAVVVSNQTFTPSAKELAQSSGVLLLHHEMLSDLESMM